VCSSSRQGASDCLSQTHLGDEEESPIWAISSADMRRPSLPLDAAIQVETCRRKLTTRFLLHSPSLGWRSASCGALRHRMNTDHTLGRVGQAISLADPGNVFARSRPSACVSSSSPSTRFALKLCSFLDHWSGTVRSEIEDGRFAQPASFSFPGYAIGKRPRRWLRRARSSVVRNERSKRLCRSFGESLPGTTPHLR